MNLKRVLNKKIVSLVAGFAAAAVLSVSGTAHAIGEGQIESGDIYRIKNLTKNSSFANTQNADKCETLQYKIRIHNPGPGVVKSVNVKVDFPENVDTKHQTKVTITGQNMQPSSTTATAILYTSSALAVKYENGSTELLDTYSKKLANLPDGITGSGVNIGNVGVSLQEIKFVQFKAKINCPEVHVESLGICKLLTLEIVNKDEREVRADLTGQTTNATIVGYSIDFDDGTTVGQQSANHKYAKDGTYNVTGAVNVKFANGQTEWKTSEDCAKQITFTPGQPPKVTPPPSKPQLPKSLPNTGPGGVVAIFAGVSAVSSFAYSFIRRRFLGL